MANQPKINKILTQAHAQNLIVPSSEENPCLAGVINTANMFLFLLTQANEQGLDNQILVARSGLHLNTIKVYTRGLAALGYLTRSEVENDYGKGARKAIWSIR